MRLRPRSALLSLGLLLVAAALVLPAPARGQGEPPPADAGSGSGSGDPTAPDEPPPDAGAGSGAGSADVALPDPAIPPAVTDDDEDDGPVRKLAGSMQIDYLRVPTDRAARAVVLDGTTVELSLKLTVDVSERVGANVKVCVACHGLEVGMAYFELHLADGLSAKVGRFTPALGNFPQRHDPANHRTSDKPLPYDMGRMIHRDSWNEGVLPAPWVDNGVELALSRDLGAVAHLDVAAYAIGGPRGDSTGFEFDYRQSRSPERYYVDNNSVPAAGGRIAVSGDHGATSWGVGASAMVGHYDPERTLTFWIVGAEASARLGRVQLRGEYLLRRLEFALGADPATRFKYGPGPGGQYDPHVATEGFYLEGEVPLGRLEVIGRWDGLRRAGNVLASSPLTDRSSVLRWTAAAAIRVMDQLRVKTSLELYYFDDFDDEAALHLGLAGPF
ncbi:MAG: hypothetical protein KBG28_23835 [Kofleriaceae bacterium]|nr:hypothetical protein [Kofleriaceae bacterium]MBP6840829.1 hypothetical protein [Kofleriaceae bacterium]MBP9207021.1 hypothetical protein [Kofleriaceae bacterium]